MHPTFQAQLRSASRTVLKAPRKQYQNPSSAAKRSFHRCARLRAADEPRNGPGSIGDADRPASPKETGHRREVAHGLPNGGASTTALPPKEQTPQEGHGPPADIAEDTRESPYGSALRRRQRSRPARETPSARLAPDWFVDHNVYLSESSLLETPPGILPIYRDRGKGYEIDYNSGEALNSERQSKDERRTDEDYEAVHGRKEDNVSQPPEEFVESPSGGLESLPGQGTTSATDDGSSTQKSWATTSDNRYFIDGLQRIEMIATAEGLLKLPVEGSKYVSELAMQKNHLQLHYPAQGGDLYLNKVVRGLARDLNCDLMILDAQDISELIANEGLGSEITTDGRLLSYEVYAQNQPPEEIVPTNSEDFEVEESEGLEESNRPNENPFGTPVIIGKPITFHLRDLAKSGRGFGRSFQSSKPSLPKLMNEIFGGQAEKPRGKGHIFSSLIESLLAAPRHKRALKTPSTLTSSAPVTPLRHGSKGKSKSLLIHVRDLKAIQDIPVGGQFLSEFFQQVQRRRVDREPILLVGTESTLESWPLYTKERIQNMQRDEVEETSRTIVITPVAPSNTSKLAFFQDKKVRTALINTRHLWTMLRYKNESLLHHLESGFWNREFLEDMSQADRLRLEEAVWSFGHVHRLATFISGARNWQPQDPKQLISFTSDVIESSDKTKWDWAEEGHPKGSKDPLRHSSVESANSRLAAIRQSATKYEQRLLRGVIEPSKISTTFNDVHAPIETIEALQTLTTLSLVRPDAFKYGVLASDRIPGLLLYGPPGTGKTLLAKAVAKESGATVLEVSAADINDMYVGEGEKNVQALFSLAKKLSPCVVFLDEADAMFSARGRSGRRVSHRELLNQFLKEWDGMNNDSGSAFIMVATNRPMDLDDAVLRRLPRRLLVDLPTEKDRIEILKIHLRNEDIADDVNISDLATRTPFYSGSDLKNLAVAAALSSVREENEVAKQYTGEEPYQYPAKRTLRSKNFDTALDEISASISEDMSSLREIKKFDEQFGDKKGRKRKTPYFGFRNAAEAEKVLDTVKVRA